MPADGAGPDDRLAEKITNGNAQDWFPHISPDDGPQYSADGKNFPPTPFMEYAQSS
jgi:hypothetical protein